MSGRALDPEDEGQDSYYMIINPMRALVIHHSAGPRSQSVKAIRDYHKQTRGYVDIAYHYIIDGAGHLHYGRPLPQAGAHALGRNKDTIGVCVIGDNRSPEHAWTPQQITSLKELLRALHLVLPGLEVIRHADAFEGHKTECPGLTRRQLQEILGSEK
jgi:N-acetyl-anhydromuramyl-L-alanine amidase AmpD